MTYFALWPTFSTTVTYIPGITLALVPLTLPWRTAHLTSPTAEQVLIIRYDHSQRVLINVLIRYHHRSCHSQRVLINVLIRYHHRSCHSQRVRINVLIRYHHRSCHSQRVLINVLIRYHHRSCHSQRVRINVLIRYHHRSCHSQRLGDLLVFIFVIHDLERKLGGHCVLVKVSHKGSRSIFDSFVGEWFKE